MEYTKETKTALIGFYSEDIVVLKFKNDQLVGISDAKEIDAALMGVIGEEKKFFIVDALDLQSNMTMDAQKFFSRDAPSAHKVSAMAILLNNLAIRLTANIFMKIHKPIYPTSTFSTQIEALNWLQQLKNNVS